MAALRIKTLLLNFSEPRACVHHLAEAVALAIGLLAGVLPAMNAARLDPLEALRAE